MHLAAGFEDNGDQARTHPTCGAGGAGTANETLGWLEEEATYCLANIPPTANTAANEAIAAAARKPPPEGGTAGVGGHEETSGK